MLKFAGRNIGLAAMLSGALITHAAAEDAKINSVSFSIDPIYQADEIVVTSSDGEKWDTIDAKALKLSANMAVDTKHPGYVDRVGIFLGACHNSQCARNPRMFAKGYATRDINDNEIVTFPGNRIPVSTGGIAIPNYGDKILKSCNEHLQADGPTKAYSFPMLMTASFSANTRKKRGTLPPIEVPENGLSFNGGDLTRQAQFRVKVTCKPVAFEVSSAELKVSVTPKNVNQDKKCPARGLVAVDIRTNRAGKVKFMLYRDDGAKQTVVADSKQVPNDASGKSFRVYWTKKYDLPKSVDRKYLVTLIGHNFSTPWQPMKLKCGAVNDAAGPGGVTTAPRPSHGKPAGGKVTGKPNKRPAVIVTPKPPKRRAKPSIKVAPLPRLVCIGGKVSRSRCFCPARTTKKKIGKNVYRCVKKVVQPRAPKSAPKRTSAAPKRMKAVAPSPANSAAVKRKGLVIRRSLQPLL